MYSLPDLRNKAETQLTDYRQRLSELPQALQVDASTEALTRVTEYVPEIVSFVQRIIDNGFAYEGEGNVYFNTEAFKASKDHHYPKLQPGNTGDDDECA